MQEKDMVNDVLSMLKSSLTGYANVISEAGNQEFRQTIQQIRNQDETGQYELFQIAAQKGYYKPAEAASPNDLQCVKSQFSS
ncbi:MAG TPA: spore coat protein [Clostridia bacterium]|nr:spore coat protein [Clostridia bacterium]